MEIETETWTSYPMATETKSLTTVQIKSFKLFELFVMVPNAKHYLVIDITS